jgi:hypothetical protein
MNCLRFDVAGTSAYEASALQILSPIKHVKQILLVDSFQSHNDLRIWAGFERYRGKLYNTILFSLHRFKKSSWAAQAHVHWISSEESDQTWDWLIIYCLTSRSKISHHYRWRAAKIRLRTFEQGGILNLSCHTCCDIGPRFFRSHPKDRPHSVASENTQGDVENLF